MVGQYFILCDLSSFTGAGKKHKGRSPNTATCGGESDSITMHNTVTVMGNLIEDPELTKTRNNNYVTKMRVACSRRVQRQVDPASAAQAQQNLANAGYNPEGAGAVEWVDMDHFFIDVECWGQLARNVKKSLIKGRPIMANGYMYTSSWEDKDGNKRSRPVLRATNVGLELSWYVAGSRRSIADDEVRLDGVELDTPHSDDGLVDTDLSDVPPPADTAGDAAAAAEPEGSGANAAATAAANKEPRSVTTTRKQSTKEPAAPF